MKRLKHSLLFLLFINIFQIIIAQNQLPYGYPDTNRQKEVLLNNWDYYLDDEKDGYLSKPPTNITWEKVSIPHSLKLSSTTNDDSKDDDYQLTFHRWVGWYKRNINVNAEKEHKVFLEFEGAHQVTKCWVNGKYVGEHTIGGYTPFHFDITAFVTKDGSNNEVVLSVDNRRNVNIPPEGDRYDYIKWSGLYRDVFLVVTDAVHITFPWEATNAGVFITTPTVTKEDATINIKTNVKNETDQPQECTVINRVINDKGVVVLKMAKTKKILATTSYTFTQTGGITENVRLWSIENPYLYRVNTTVYRNGKAVDMIENPLGIRKIELIPGRGFVLNGKNVELVGANRHQAMLFIGDAVPNSLQWKDAWQLKQSGCNSLRLAHYPHDNAFIEACDELGILLYEEPPTWIGIGGDKWMDNLEKAARIMVRNHRNHPSIVMWGAAINHRGPVERLHYACKEEDPTRFTASNGAKWTGQQHSGITDIYTPMDYNHIKIDEHEFTYLCEHGGSTDATRNQNYVSRSKQMANVIGAAYWTAHDYQTFKPKTIGNPKRIFSIDRVPNPSFYWYQTETSKVPMVYLTDRIVSTEDKIVVFSNCQRVDLYNDNQLIERRFPDKNNTSLYVNSPNFIFNYKWKRGKLIAKGYVDNKLVATDSRTIPEDPYKLKVKIELDNKAFSANGSDIKTVQCYILDKNGARVIDAKNKVTFIVEGEGELIEHPDIDANPRTPFLGVATAYVRSSVNAGFLKVIAKAEGIRKSTSDQVVTIPFKYNRIKAEAKPIYDLKAEKIDISSGMEGVNRGTARTFEFGKHKADVIYSEYTQFGWTSWVGTSALKETFKSGIFKDCSYKITAKDTLQWFSSWGQSGNLPYLAIDGVKLKSESPLKLSITGLPKGIYELETWHHNSISKKKKAGILKIEVNDAKGENRTIEKEITMSKGDLTSKFPVSAKYKIYSNGIGDVVVSFIAVEKDFETCFNGFKIKETIEMFMEK